MQKEMAKGQFLYCKQEAMFQSVDLSRHFCGSSTILERIRAAFAVSFEHILVQEWSRTRQDKNFDSSARLPDSEQQ